MPTPTTSPPTSGLAPLERLVVALALLLGLGLRLFEVGAPFDRQFDGFQGSFFAIAAINFERLGPAALAGYPVANIDPTPGERDTYYAYANHPPLVPWLAWGSLRLMGPRGWQDAWREGRAPEGLELPLRLPFLALHLIGWLALYLGIRWAGAPRTAAFTAALFGLLPIAFLYAGLVNYENPSIAFLGVGLACLVRAGQTKARGPLLAACCAAALAGATTFAPAFFLPGIWIWLIGSRGRRGLGQAAGFSAALALPLLLHGHFAARALALVGEAPDSLTARVGHLIAPLLDGSLPLPRWLATQARISWEYFGPAAVCLAGVGLFSAGLGVLRGRNEAARLAWVWLLGGLAVQLGFYRHTGDPQEPFLLNLAPGIAALAGWALALATQTPADGGRSRAGLTGALGLLAACLLGLSSAVKLHTQWRGSDRPMPREIGQQLGELLPPGSLGWYPEGLGFNNAVSFYAWRSLLPVGPGTYELAQLQAERFGMSKRPLFVMLPKAAPSGAEASVAAVANDLESKRPGKLLAPDAETADYQGFRIAN